MAFLRRPVTLKWVPRGLRLELEVAARPDGDGRLVPVRSRRGGVPARRGWLCAAADSPLLLDAMLGRDADWVLGATKRRWTTIAKRVGTPEDESERLARAGIVEIECRLTNALGLGGYTGWRLTGEAAEVAARRAAARRSLRTDLERELRDKDLVERLRDGRPRPGMSWLDYVRVLRAAELWRDITKNGRLPPERELAAMVSWSKWPWTSARRALLAEVVGCAESELFVPKRRVIRIKGPLTHGQGDVWADAVDTIALALSGPLHGIVCIENRQTFDALYPFGSRNWMLLEMGGPVPAECRLLERLHALAPQAPVLAAFDPDPAGIEIALGVAHRAGVTFEVDLMTPTVLAATTSLELVPWDRETLADLEGRAGVFEPLRAAITAKARKGEQEAAHELLIELMELMTAAAPGSRIPPDHEGTCGRGPAPTGCDQRHVRHCVLTDERGPTLPHR
jgi:hypothetical protein